MKNSLPDGGNLTFSYQETSGCMDCGSSVGLDSTSFLTRTSVFSSLSWSPGSTFQGTSASSSSKVCRISISTVYSAVQWTDVWLCVSHWGTTTSSPTPGPLSPAPLGSCSCSWSLCSSSCWMKRFRIVTRWCFSQLCEDEIFSCWCCFLDWQAPVSAGQVNIYIQVGRNYF